MTRLTLAVACSILHLGCGAPEPHCLERARPIDSGNASALTRAESWSAELARERVEPLQWRDATSATVTLTFGTPTPLWVESRRNPDDHTDIGVECLDRVRMAASLTVTSSDGRLREQLERVAFDEDPNGVLRARFARKASALSNGYVVQNAGDRRKFAALNFELELGPDSLRGALYEGFQSSGGATESAAIAQIGEASKP